MCAPASPQPISCVSWCPWEADDISTSSWEQLIDPEVLSNFYKLKGWLRAVQGK